MTRYCPKHPKQKLIQLFSSWACDVCDGKQPKTFDGSRARLKFGDTVIESYSFGDYRFDRNTGEFVKFNWNGKEWVIETVQTTPHKIP